MKHGFLILTHHSPKKTYDQVARLQSPNHYFFIHFDKKAQIDEEDEFYKKLAGYSNVHILKDRITIQWGSMSIVKATINLMREALKTPDIGYLHLISGECMPVKSNSYFDDFFERNNGKQFLHHFPLPKSGTGPTFQRLNKYHFHDYFNPRSAKPKDVVIKYINSGLRKLQRGLGAIGIHRRYSSKLPALYAGSQWWSLSSAMCNYVLHYLQEHPEFMARFRFSQIPDELFIQTIVMNSPFSKDALNQNLRFINFAGATSSPHPLTMANLEDIAKEDILIARKFTVESKELLGYLDKNVLGIKAL